MNQKEIILRPATSEDSEAIRQIMAYYIENTTASWRYDVLAADTFQDYVKAHQKPNRPMWVAVKGQEIVGYSCLSDFRSPEGYWPCTENSVYVKPGYEHAGIGSALMETILREGRLAGVKTVIAVIDADNEASIKFHERFGFVQAGVLKNIGFKMDRWLSAVFMQCDL